MRSRRAALPIDLDRLVGRDRDISELGDVLARHRLVTLVGPGGVGKTRLAGEVARTVAVASQHRVLVVELAVLCEPSLVPIVIRAALGLADERGASTVNDLVRILRRRRVLLMLDKLRAPGHERWEIEGHRIGAHREVRQLLVSIARAS
jgi:hypothetical protein